MRILLYSLALVAASVSAQDVSPVPDSARQLVVVTTETWAATDGALQRYVRNGDFWEAVGPEVAVVVGRSGLGWGRGLHGAPDGFDGPAKAEGDGRAPAGVFRLSAAFGYAEAEATGLPYVPTDADVECVDDRASDAYNLVLDRGSVPEADWTSHEEMRRRDGLYRIGVIVAHNGPGVDPALLPASREAASASAPVAGGGSCIFLHVWRGPGTSTAGCTAMPDPALQDVMAWLDADAHPVLVQLPEAEALARRAAWGLP